MYPFQSKEDSQGLSFSFENYHVYFGNKNLKPEDLGNKHPSVQIQYVKQTHSTIIARYPEVKDECDGYQWDKTHFAAIIRTADCLPLIAIDHNSGQISNLHCGRVGLVNGILNEFIKNSDVNNTHSFFIGPHIMTYEIGPDLYQQLHDQGISDLEVIDGKYYFSLAKFTKIILEKHFKKSKIYECNINTLTNTSYWSYRLDKGTNNRNLSYAYKEDK